MRIAALNQVYWPDLAATSQLLTDLCEHLVQSGHVVDVICGRTRYAGDIGELAALETRNGVHIHRLWTPPVGRGSLAARAVDFAGFNTAALAKLMELPRMDAVMALTTPPLVSSVGLAVKKLRGSRLIHWVQDFYPDVAVALGALTSTGAVTLASATLNRAVLRGADTTVVLGEAMAARVVDNGAPTEQVRVIHNWADGAAITPRARADHPLRQQWNIGARRCVMYSGNFGLAHDFDTVRAAVSRFEHRDDIVFVFIGDGPRHQSLKDDLGHLSCVRFLPLLPREQLGLSLTAADVHLISLRDGVSGMVVPSKLYGALAAGRPSIYVGPRDSDVWRTLTTEQAGVCIENGDVDSLEVALSAPLNELEDTGQRARHAFIARYDRPIALAHWLAVIEGR